MAEPVLHLAIPVRDLAEARAFYVDALGCQVGRVRPTWIDVWFFGMQITLAEQPDEVWPVEEQGVRHFGVVLPDPATHASVITRLREHDVTWVSPPTDHTELELSGKRSAKVADPSGNIIEIKHYPDPAALRV